MRSPTTTVLHISHPHSAEDHGKDKDQCAHLSYTEKVFIKQAVKISPIQSTGDLLRNEQDDEECIDFKLKKSVHYHIRKERRGLRAYLLDGVEVDNRIGSLQRLADMIWFGDALKNYREGECLDLFKVYCIGKQFMDWDRNIMISFSNVWDLLNFWRSLASGYNLQNVCDVTSKCSTAAVNKHTIGVNMLGGKAAPVSFTLIQHQLESEVVHTEAYHAMRRALRFFIALPTCDKPDCETCRCLHDLRSDDTVRSRHPRTSKTTSCRSAMPCRTTPGLFRTSSSTC